MTGKFERVIASGLLLIASAVLAPAQSGSVRPRRVNPPPSSAGQTSDTSTASSSSSDDASPGIGRANRPSSNINTPDASRSVAGGDTSRAFALFQQKQYAESAREARRIAAA